jgi:ribokinase
MVGPQEVRMTGHIAVVGSLSADMVFQVPRRPAKGETIAGTDFSLFVGGKGNNQALAAGRCGASVKMIGRVGNDSYAEMIAGKLIDSGVDVTHLIKDGTVGTGVANIYVDPEGDNSIVIVPQANARLSPRDIEQAAETIRSARVLLMQMEIPLETIECAARMAREAGVTVLLNPAPAPIDGVIPDTILRNVDVLIPNQTEAELLTGFPVRNKEESIAAADKISALGPKTIIITLGEQGAFLRSEDHETHIGSFPVKALDSTAAGDAFCGALAAAIVHGATMSESVAYACAAGALATTRRGAEPSLPRREEIEKLMSASCSA